MRYGVIVVLALLAGGGGAYVWRMRAVAETAQREQALLAELRAAERDRGRARQAIQTRNARLGQAATPPPPHRIISAVTVGPPDVRGSISAVGVRRVAKSHANQFVGCPVSADWTQARIALKFIIKSNGYVQVAAIADASIPKVDDDLAACMLNRLKTWPFPPLRLRGGGIAVVILSFDLEASEGSPAK